MKKQYIIISVVAVLILGIVMLLRWDPQGQVAATSENVTVVDGTQYIDLTAKGGYSPRKTVAKAGLPTVLKVTTNGTYDCSATITLPGLNVRQDLPASGTTQINLGTPEAINMQGSCGMGMYPFEIDFQS